METYQIEKEYEGDWIGKFATKKDYDVLLEDKTVKVIKPDGNHLLTIIKKAVPLDIIKPAWSALEPWNPKTDNRSTASGTKIINETKRDGTISNTNRIKRIDQVTSGVMGFYDRYARFPYCRPCSWNDHHAGLWSLVEPMISSVSQAHKQGCPEIYAKQKDLWDQTTPDFKIPDSIYTTVTINKNYRTAYHYDAKNLEGMVSAMLCIRQGKIQGGYTVFPKYRVAAALDTGDVILFDGQGEVHGNTAINLLTSNAQRCTLVHYFRAGMIYCGTKDQELERAKRRKQGETLMKDNLNPLMDNL